MVVTTEWCVHHFIIDGANVGECKHCHEMRRFPFDSAGEVEVLELGVYPRPKSGVLCEPSYSYIPKSLMNGNRWWRERRGRPATGRLGQCWGCSKPIYTRRYRVEADPKSGWYCRRCHSAKNLRQRRRRRVDEKPLPWQEFEAICAGNTEMPVIDEATRLLPYRYRGEVRQEAAMQCLEIGLMNLSESDILIIVEGARRKIRNEAIRQRYQQTSLFSKPYGDDGPELWELIVEEDVAGMCAKQGWKFRRELE